MGVAGKLISIFPETLVFLLFVLFDSTHCSTNICTIGEKCVEKAWIKSIHQRDNCFGTYPTNQYSDHKPSIIISIPSWICTRHYTAYNNVLIKECPSPKFRELKKKLFVFYFFIVSLLTNFFCADDLISYEIRLVSSTKRFRRTVREPVHAHRSNSRSHA